MATYLIIAATGRRSQMLWHSVCPYICMYIKYRPWNSFAPPRHLAIRDTRGRIEFCDSNGKSVPHPVSVGGRLETVVEPISLPILRNYWFRIAQVDLLWWTETHQIFNTDDNFVLSVTYRLLFITTWYYLYMFKWPSIIELRHKWNVPGVEYYHRPELFSPKTNIIFRDTGHTIIKCELHYVHICPSIKISA